MSDFDTLDSFIALPRVNAIALSPDGTQLIATIAHLNEKRTAWVNQLWRLDPDGAAPARQLTRDEKPATSPAFTPEGDILFIAAREEDAPAALYLLPRDGGEPRIVATHPGGVSAVQVRGTTVLITADALPHAKDLADEERLRTARKDNKVTAILHTEHPVRYWDHDLGPGAPRLYTADLTELATAEKLTLRDLTPDAGSALIEASTDLAPDGSAIFTTWNVPTGNADFRSTLVRIDLATAQRQTLISDDDADVIHVRVSPDSSKLAVILETVPSPQRAPRVTAAALNADGTDRQQLAPDWDNWPGSLTWHPTSDALYVAADFDGRGPVFRLLLDGSAPTRLTDDGTYLSLQSGPDALYALRTSYAAPSEVVRVATDGGDDVVVPTVPLPTLPGTLTEVETIAPDGARVRGWLALPDGASAAAPAPLLLWVHGGPLSSWNGWSWRWNPWVMVARGYAVLLPDPALSTGYGQDFIQRGWGAWGAAPFTDLMAITDAVEERSDIDATRTGAMGGSFGGYMANWIAGHTDRFRAIVTHASLWALDQFGHTTDAPQYWKHEMDAAMAQANSPHNSVGEIRTPMLVVHGDHDYRVPIGEGLRLWYELLSASGLPAGPDGTSPHRFLYFPTENHWVLTPQHSKLWYAVILNFLAEHVLGAAPTEDVELLG